MDPYRPPLTPRPPEEPPVLPQQPLTASEARDRGTSFWARITGPVLGGVAGSVLTLALLAAAGVFQDPELPEPSPPGTTVIREVVERPVIASTADNQVAAIAERAVPSIVSVNVGFRAADDTFESVGSGSGVVFGEDGFIITNNHVVEGGHDVQVTFPDGRIYPARVEGTDPLTDLAVIKVGTVDVVPITLADLSSLAIGDLAVAVGNPLALRGGPSVTSGIVSAFDRTLDVEDGTRLFGLIQTDAPITRGSSGGALLNEQGQLIGITTAIGTSGIAAEGLGFAVPVNIVRQVVDDLIREGEVRHAFLGITGREALESRDDGSSIPRGALIDEIEAGSAIALAGAQVGDIIIAFDGERIEKMDQLVALLRNYRADQTVEVTVLRGSTEIGLVVTLDLRPDDL